MQFQFSKPGTELTGPSDLLGLNDPVDLGHEPGPIFLKQRITQRDGRVTCRRELITGLDLVELMSREQTP